MRRAWAMLLCLVASGASAFIWNQVMPIDANGDVVEASGSPSGGAVLRALRQKYMRERDERERADREFYARLEAGDEQ